MASKKGSSPRVSSYYKIDDGKFARTRKPCSRCGKGVFMSNHADRNACGQCGLTEFK